MFTPLSTGVPVAKSPSRVEATISGRIPGFRVWTLRAYDENDRVIVEVSENFEAFVSMVAFSLELGKKGYTLTGTQVNQLSSALNIGAANIVQEVSANYLAFCSAKHCLIYYAHH